jgi:hypothetical protein
MKNGLVCQLNSGHSIWGAVMVSSPQMEKQIDQSDMSGLSKDTGLNLAYEGESGISREHHHGLAGYGRFGSNSFRYRP